MSKKPRPICPKCGERARRTKTQYGLRHDCKPCGLWSWGNHPLVDRATHEARKAAHAAFDPIWQSGLVQRPVAYKALADTLGLPVAETHMKLMDAQTARRVPDAALRIRREFDNG